MLKDRPGFQGDISGWDYRKLSEYLVEIQARMERDVTESELALALYNFSRRKDISETEKKSDIGAMKLFFGWQDRIDPLGNAALNITGKEVLAGVRPGIDVILDERGDPGVEYATAMQKFSKNMRKTFRKNGVEVVYKAIEDTDKIDEVLETAFEILRSNKKKHPLIFFKYLTEEGKKKVKEYLSTLTPEQAALLAIGKSDTGASEIKDFRENILRLVYFATVMLDDKRSREYFNRSPEDLAEMRRLRISSLTRSRFFDEEELFEYFDGNLSGATAEQLEDFMKKVMTGEIGIKITRINFNEIKDLYEAMKEVESSL